MLRTRHDHGTQRRSQLMRKEALGSRRLSGNRLAVGNTTQYSAGGFIQCRSTASYETNTQTKQARYAFLRCPGNHLQSLEARRYDAHMHDPSK